MNRLHNIYLHNFLSRELWYKCQKMSTVTFPSPVNKSRNSTDFSVVESVQKTKKQIQSSISQRKSKTNWARLPSLNYWRRVRNIQRSYHNMRRENGLTQPSPIITDMQIGSEQQQKQLPKSFKIYKASTQTVSWKTYTTQLKRLDVWQFSHSRMQNPLTKKQKTWPQKHCISQQVSNTSKNNSNDQSSEVQQEDLLMAETNS
ncbi:MAG: hypothetical protein EXX96DRAFT_650980, partial [Benjaminiella poitrasii]